MQSILNQYGLNWVLLLITCCLIGLHAPAANAQSIDYKSFGINPQQIADQLMKEVPPLDKPLHMKACLFDPLGKVGPIYRVAKDIALAAQRWNLFVELQVFTNEGVAAQSFTTGQCELVGLTTLRARQYSHFMGSIDAIGGITDYRQMATLIWTLMTSEKLYPRSINGPYQIAGIGPIGAAYVIVNDRSISSIEKAAGKRIAVMDWDKSQARMVQGLGAQPVASDITNFHTKFNNGFAVIMNPHLLNALWQMRRSQKNDAAPTSAGGIALCFHASIFCCREQA